MEENYHEINIKGERLDYDINDIVKPEEILESEVTSFGNVNRFIKSEVDEYDNIKDEPEYCNVNDIDSICDTGLIQNFPSRNMITTKVEKSCNVGFKYERQEYELDRSTIQNANKNPEAQFKCYGCNYQSKCKRNLKRHILAIHESDKVRRYACKLCHYKTAVKGDLNKHFSHKHEKDKASRYLCEFCSFQTIYKQSLNKHIKYLHQNIAKQFECYKCNYKSECKDSVKRHNLATHENEKAPQYACKLCPFQTIKKGYLNRHIKTHTGFSLKCTLCQKTFKQKSSLDVHYVSAHLDQSDSFKHLLTYTVKHCHKSKCSYVAVNTSSLKNHLQTHEEDQNKLKFQCNMCGCRCIDKNKLKRHLRLHADQLPFVCTVCNKEFNEKKQLDGHIVFQHKENLHLMKTVTSKIHECLKCTFKTVYTTHFKNHQTRIHGSRLQGL